MIFERRHGPANVLSVVERKTRFAVLMKKNGRRPRPLMAALIEAMAPLPLEARRSITFDRGFEFTAWRKLGTGMGTSAWFCDPQAPWQKGSAKNLNRRARRYLPRDAELTAISGRSISAICDRLNTTPRKCLAHRTPAEAFPEERANRL